MPSVFIKCHQVIASCKTVEQIFVAMKFVSLARKNKDISWKDKELLDAKAVSLLENKNIKWSEWGNR